MKTRCRRRLSVLKPESTCLSPQLKTLLKTPKHKTQSFFEENHFRREEQEHAGKNGQVFLVTKSPSASNPKSEKNIKLKREINAPQTPKNYAVKKQKIQSPKNLMDRSYRELIVCRRLNKLREMKKYYPRDPNDCNFVQLFQWDKRQKDEQYMYLVLERAKSNLHEIKNRLTTAEYKGVLFQILFALHVAQKEFQFNHNDLHLKNVLLVEPKQPNDFGTFKDEADIWYTLGYKVKLTDFGLSRITVNGGKVVYSHRNSLSSEFSSSSDVEKLYNELRTVNPTDCERGTSDHDSLHKLKVSMRKGVSIGTLLRCEFFDSLKRFPNTSTFDLLSRRNSSPAVSPTKTIKMKKKEEIPLFATKNHSKILLKEEDKIRLIVTKEVTKIHQISSNNDSKFTKISQISTNNDTKIPKISQISTNNDTKIPKISQILTKNDTKILQIAAKNDPKNPIETQIPKIDEKNLLDKENIIDDEIVIRKCELPWLRFAPIKINKVTNQGSRKRKSNVVQLRDRKKKKKALRV